MAREVRVYLLVTLEGKPSRYLDPVVAESQNVGALVSFETAGYRF